MCLIGELAAHCDRQGCDTALQRVTKVVNIALTRTVVTFAGTGLFAICRR